MRSLALGMDSNSGFGFIHDNSIRNTARRCNDLGSALHIIRCGGHHAPISGLVLVQYLLYARLDGGCITIHCLFF